MGNTHLSEQFHQVQDKLSGEAKLCEQEVVRDRVQVEAVQGLVASAM